MFDKFNHSPTALDVEIERRREGIEEERNRQAAMLRDRQASGAMITGPRSLFRVQGCRNVYGG